MPFDPPRSAVGPLYHLPGGDEDDKRTKKKKNQKKKEYEREYGASIFYLLDYPLRFSRAAILDGHGLARATLRQGRRREEEGRK